jgi:quercetin dioxygenase-like cupin family protein
MIGKSSRTSSSIAAISFASGKGLDENISRFDTYIQVIEGAAEVIIEGKVTVLECGQGMTIPANTTRQIKSERAFKIMMTVFEH